MLLSVALALAMAAVMNVSGQLTITTSPAATATDTTSIDSTLMATATMSLVTIPPRPSVSATMTLVTIPPGPSVSATVTLVTVPPRPSVTATVTLVTVPPRPSVTATVTLVTIPPLPSVTATVTLVTVPPRPPTTTTAPTPTVIYVHKECQNLVRCPHGTVQKPGHKGCINTVYQDTIISTTCVPAYCCTSLTPGTYCKLTTCQAAKVRCPLFCLPLYDTKGIAVPCLNIFTGNKLVSTTCNTSTCCTMPVHNKDVPCNYHVKCYTYKVAPGTRKIQTCSTNTHSSYACTTTRCCGRVSPP